MMDDNRKSCSLNRGKTENMTFKAKGFLNFFIGLPAIEQFAEAKRLEVEILKK